MKKTNEFDFVQAAESTPVESRKLQHTNRLIDSSKARAIEIMRGIGQAEADDKSQLIAWIDSGKAEDLIQLINRFIDQETIKADAQFLGSASEDELSKLLESRRSDRSKTLRKGPRSSVTVCQQYIATMYAELLVREAWGKPYAGGTTESVVDEQDLDAVKRKIKSLQSKKCRLNKTAEFVEADRIELEAVEAEIARLSSFRPKIAAKTAVKSADVSAIREALQLVQHTLSAEELDKYKKAGLL